MSLGVFCPIDLSTIRTVVLHFVADTDDHSEEQTEPAHHWMLFIDLGRGDVSVSGSPSPSCL